MSKKKDRLNVKIRNVTVDDIKEVYKLLIENRPYVGLNSRYTYFLLARDFSDTCVVAEHKGKIIGFSSGYVSPSRSDTFFNWETVVNKDYRGNSLQKQMLLYQIKNAKVIYFEGTINPSNKVSENNFFELANLLNTKCQKRVLFKEEDFENDGHEAEILCRIGPIPQNEVEYEK